MAKKRASKQGRFAGMEPITIEEIEQRFVLYEEVKAERQEKLREEVDLKRELIELLHGNRGKLPKDKDGNKFYKSDDLGKKLVLVTGGEKLKVQRVKEDVQEV